MKEERGREWEWEGEDVFSSFTIAPPSFVGPGAIFVRAEPWKESGKNRRLSQPMRAKRREGGIDLSWEASSFPCFPPPHPSPAVLARKGMEWGALPLTSCLSWKKLTGWRLDGREKTMSLSSLAAWARAATYFSRLLGKILC